MSYEYSALEKKLRGLVNSFTYIFTASQMTEVNRFLDVGEYGLAFETLCQIATEENKQIPTELYSPIRELAEHMDIDEEYWINLIVK